jgi:excisionase family DNA binding protein
MASEEVPKDYFSVAEMAAKFDVSKCTVRRWAKAGKIKAYQPAGSHGMFRFPLDCIEQSQVLPSTPSAKPAADGRLSGPKPKWLQDDT